MIAVEYPPRRVSRRSPVLATVSFGSGGISDRYEVVEVRSPFLAKIPGGELASTAKRHGSRGYLFVLDELSSVETVGLRCEFDRRQVGHEPVRPLAFASWMRSGYSPEETQGVSTSYVSHAEKVLSHLYLLTVKDRKQQALEVAFEFIESEFAADNVESVDEALHKLTVNRIPIPLLVGILRATSRARSVLPSWSRLLHGAQSYIDASQMNSKRVLRGLLPRAR